MLIKNKKALIDHIHRIEGQIKGLEKMVEKGEYCVKVITQSLAVQKSLQSLNQRLLENHLAEHVAHQFQHGQGGKAIKELSEIYSLKNK